MSDYEKLLACYLSGQVPEAAWQEHLAADPEFARWVAERMAERRADA